MLLCWKNVNSIYNFRFLNVLQESALTVLSTYLLKWNETKWNDMISI